MNNTINTYLGNLHIGAQQAHKNLAMYPIICPEGLALTTCCWMKPWPVTY